MTIEVLRTQVAIVGGGPAGLLLSQLLHMHGIQSILIERKSAEHVVSRIRAGVLEEGTVATLERANVAHRLSSEAQRHGGFNLAAGGRICRIALDELTGGHVTVYGQTEVTKDLLRARRELDAQMYHEVSNVTLHDLHTETACVMFDWQGSSWRIEADFVAGCDGFHGPSRQSIPQLDRREFERVYPFGWLGILSDVPPCRDELIYARSERGFALASMRSATRSRYYIQCRADESLESWPDERLWAELKLRLGSDVAADITTGPALEKSIAPLRSFVCETMRYGRLFLAGDAAHIVPPTGAKGLNLAVGDVHYLSTALVAFYRQRSELGLNRYAEVALRRIWKAEHFSWRLTSLLHDFENEEPFMKRMRTAELDYIFSSTAAQATLAEHYIGLPFETLV